MSSLNSLLDRAQSFAPTYYKQHLSNHLPMSLVALHALGATDEQTERGFAQFSRKLEPAAQTTEPCANWPRWRGQREAFAAVRAHFVREISARGVEATLRAALPLLIDGVGAAAFHGLLRAASAIVARHDDELASGLAHWACSHRPLVRSRQTDATIVAVHPAQKLELREWLFEITSIPVPQKSPESMIATLMHDYSKSETFQNAAPRLRVRDDTLRELANIALEHYLRSRNFTVLHLITGTHAMRLLLPYCDTPELALRHYAIAFAAGVAASGIKADAAALPVALRSWQTLREIACGDDDEHVIKLIYACREEFQVNADERYRQAASLVLRRD